MMMGRYDKERKLPKALRGFEKISRYFDLKDELVTAKLLPGEFYVTDKNEQISTVLGSCISACIRDRVTGVGGMNHFMLPNCANDDHIHAGDMSAAARYGSYAMEHLINEILKNGGSKRYMEVKIFGGGRILNAMTDIGAKNIEFVRDFLHAEGLILTAEDVGSVYPRKVVYQPLTGKVRVRRLRSVNKDVAIEEQHYQQTIESSSLDGDVDLF